MKLHRIVFPTLILAGAVAVPGSYAYATLLTGNLAVNGAGAVAVNSDGTNYVIDFEPPVDPAGNGTGTVNIVGGSTGSFAGLVGTQATMRDLNSTDVPVGASVNYQNFVTFSDPSASQWTITLTKLLPGVFSSGSCFSAPAAGQTCTVNLPGVSDFNWANTSASSSTVSATFSGLATDKATGQTTAVHGTIGATFSDLSYQQVLANAIAGNTIVTSYSGTITAVPEPASASLMLVGGLLAVGMAVSRRLQG